MKLPFFAIGFFSSAAFAANLSGLTLFGATLAPTPATSPAETLKSHATVIVEKLLQDGHQRIGKLDLKLLVGRIKTIEWKDDPTIKMPDVVSTRTTAVCYPWMYKVSVRSLRPDIDRQSLEMIALHESLCAIGYQDLNGEMSTYMAILKESGRKEIAADDPVVQALFDSPILYHIPKLYSGGVTSIGGGGDLTAQKIKYEALLMLNKRMRLNESFVMAWLITPFEPNEEMTAVHVESLAFARYTFQASNNNSQSMSRWLYMAETGKWPGSVYVGSSQWVKVTLPTKLWRNNREARRQILEDSIAIMNSIFIANEKEQPLRIYRIDHNEAYVMPTIKSPLIQSHYLKLVDPRFKELVKSL